MRRRLAMAFLATATSQPAAAAWLEASSDHFIIYSDTSPEQLQAFADRLERFDAGLRHVFLPNAAADTGRRSNRLRIFVLENAAAVRRLCRASCRNILGFYTPRIGGSVAFTPRRAGDGSKLDIDPETVLFHEYSHHFMYANFTAAYPAWYAEGFAEFNSTALFQRDGSLGLGAPALHRAYDLVLGGADLSTERLFETAADRQDDLTMRGLYARGWLLTHYLTFEAKRRGQLNNYIRDVNAGTPSLAAAKAAFGDLKQLDRELDRYQKSRRMSYAVLPASKLSTGSVVVRRLGAGEAAMMPVRIRSTRGVSRDEAEALLPEARRIAAGYPNDADVQVQLAEAEHDADNLKEAEAAADRALAADPDHARALLYKGLIQADLVADSATMEPTAWRGVRSWFLKANKVDADAAEPLYHFYSSFARSGMRPPRNAVLGLQRAFQLAPEDTGLRLTVAFQAIADKDAALARRALAPLAFDPHGGGLSTYAAKAVALIDAGKLEEAGKAMQGQAAEAAEE
jgi:tetratricopeptide (TPR) repeat protein